MSIPQKQLLLASIILGFAMTLGYTVYAAFPLITLLPTALITIIIILGIKKNLLQTTTRDQELLELKRVKHLYAFISQVNQNIVRVKDEETLFKNACSIAIEFGKFQMAWIGMFNADHKEISLLVQSGVPDEVMSLFENARIQINGPQDRVLKTGSYYICNDVANDPDLMNWKSFAAMHDVCSCMVLPIKKAGSIIGTFNLYSSVLNFGQQEEIKLLVEVAGDLSFALDLFEKEKKYLYTQELIIQNEKRFRTLIEKSADIIVFTNIDGELTYGSSSITTVLGYSLAEVVAMSIFDIIHPDDLPEFNMERNKILQLPGRSFNYQQRRKHKNGGWIWCEGTLTNLLREPGIFAMVSNFRDISEKKRQEHLREFDKNNLDALINNTNDLMWSVDKGFKLITSNKPFDRVVKKLAGHEIAKGGNVLNGSGSVAEAGRYKDYYDRAFLGESFSEIEYTPLPVKSWSEISFCPIRKGTAVMGTACHSRDITTEKKAMQQSQESEIFNRGVLNSLSSHIAVIDEFGKLVAVNKAWERFSLENGETNLQRTGIGSNYFDVCKRGAKQGDNIAAQALQGIKDVMAEKIPVFYMEYPCHGPAQQRWFGMRVLKFESDVQMVVVAHQNITERKLAEKYLFQSEARLTEAQAIANIGNFEVDMGNYSEVWSDEMYKIYGINKAEVTASKELFLSFIHPDDLGYVQAEMDECIEMFKSSAVNFRFIRKDGNLRYGYSEARFALDENRNISRIYGIVQDITDRKLAEIERSKIVNDLITRNKDLEQFAYIISHNLRAPIANIIGASDALKDAELDLEEKAMFNKGIDQSINKLDGVVKDLNQILEVKSEINETKEVVIFSELVEDISNSIADLIAAGDIEIKSDFSEINEFITLKPFLYSVFYNLISNSIKYRRPEVKALIQIVSHRLKNKLELIFSDNGLGIDLVKNGDEVFSLYKRFHHHIEGKGMGLFMVKTQIENLGGQIAIQSKPHIGTVFTITFEI